MSKKYKNIVVLNNEITITDDDFISLTDMLKSKDGDFFISDWLRNRNTLEYLGIWERIYNPDFNYGEFAAIKSQLTKINYRIHTDAVKENLIPENLTPKQISFVYANEADVLNMALFGKTAKEWREGTATGSASDKKGNIRDYANVS